MTNGNDDRDIAQRIRELDWSTTSLGPMDSWPVQLKSAVEILLPSAAQIVLFCGPEFVAIYNDAYAPSIGSKHPGALGRAAQENWSELWDDLEPMLRRVLETGQTISAKDRPFYIERPFPETVYFDISYSPVRRDDGGVVAVMCIVSETTGQVRAQDTLKRSEARLRSIFDSATVGVVQADLSGRVSYVNPGFCHIVGYQEGELICRRYVDITHRDDLPENEALFKRLASTGEGFVIEKRYVHKDGTPVWVTNHVSALTTADGGIDEAVAIVVDISNQRRALHAERRLAAIIASSEDAIVGIDLEMTVTDWNHGAEEMYGYSAEEAIGQSVTIIIPDDRVEEELRIVERIRSGVRVEPHDTVRRHRDGHDVEVSLSVSPIYDAHGRIAGASKIARDIGIRKDAERIQTLLVGELGHRIKNLLATVMAIARQTFSRATDIELATADFDGRLRSLARAHDLITHGSWESASLLRLVEEAIAPYARDRFRLEGPDIPISPKGVVAMSLVLHELSTNALKYGALSTECGSVDVSWDVSSGPAPRFRLVWHEMGGPIVAVPSRKGFGSRLISGLISGELAGTVETIFEETGMRCVIEAPLTANWDTGGVASGSDSAT